MKSTIEYWDQLLAECAPDSSNNLTGEQVAEVLKTFVLKAQETFDQMRAGIKEYRILTRHTPDCKTRREMYFPCDCGLYDWETLMGIEETVDEKF